MIADPADSCTFWLTSDYNNDASQPNNVTVRVAAFRFPGCAGGAFPPPSPTLHGTTVAPGQKLSLTLHGTVWIHAAGLAANGAASADTTMRLPAAAQAAQAAQPAP